MKIVIFGNGSIGKTLRAIEDFKTEIISVDLNKKSKPNIVGNINDQGLRSKLLGPGDILVDLTANNDAVPISSWCFEHNISYLNSDMSSPTALVDVEKRFDQIKNIFDKKNKQSGSTIFYCQGMNPGMVSHYFSEIIATYQITKEEIEEVHVSEIDTQISDKMPEENTLISTWCVAGNLADTLDSSSLSKKKYWLEKLGKLYSKARKNHYWTKNPWEGRFNTYLSGNHEEIYEIGKKYDIPVCFSYKSPAQFNEASKNMTKKSKFKPHIMSQDTICGHNIVGIYLRKKCGKEYWCGSKLDISNARGKIKNNVDDLILNATTVLTASGVYAGIKYIINNPNKGWVLPLDVDSSFMINEAKSLLGEYFIGELKIA
jgi:homospermidine synthase